MATTVTTKAPTGLSVTLADGKVTFSWKAGDSNYSSGQKLQYKMGEEDWHSLTISTGTRSKTLTISKTAFFPETEKLVNTISFRVQGQRSSYKKKGKTYKPKMSAWTAYTYKVYAPEKPSVEASWSGQDQAKTCLFYWSLQEDDTAEASTTTVSDNKPFKRFEWQSVLIKDSTWSEGKNIPDTEWAGDYFTSGTATIADHKRFDETFVETAGYSYTRWFRARAQGIGGSSDWKYARHVYSRPLQANDVQGTITRRANNNGYMIDATWITQSDESKPIDSVELQYVITAPKSDIKTEDGYKRVTLSCPDSASWSTARTLADTSGTESATFEVPTMLQDDELIYIRVNTVHDEETTTGEPTLVTKDDLTLTSLAPPIISSITTESSNHKVQMGIANNSSVTGSVVAIYYKDSSAASEQLIGIFDGFSQTVVNIQCPDWGEGTPTFGARTFVCDYTPTTQASEGVTSYLMSNIQMQSGAIIWSGGDVAAPPEVTLSQVDSTTVRVNWTWPWTEASTTEISWASREDAWESNSQPSTYTVSAYKQSSWIISGLDVGTWYFRVRLLGDSADGLYSGTKTIKLSSAPATPSLTLSESVIAEDGSTTCYWSYVTTDGTSQSKAEIIEAFVADDGSVTYADSILATETTAQHITITASDHGWKAGEKHYLAVRVSSESGETSNGWSSPVAVSIAAKPSIVVTENSLVTVTETLDDGTESSYLALTKMPLMVSVTGAGTDGTIYLAIERTSAYHIVRPDDSEIDGYQGETVILKSRSGDGEFSIDNNDTDFTGYLDDGAPYTMTISVKDSLGQEASVSYDFMVNWEHQAFIPEVTIEVNNNANVVYITPNATEEYLEGDTCDIYRLSADKPELIYQGAKFGTTYVDPYPTIGEFGGHRVVTKTANGDYMTAESHLAWTDLTYDDGDAIDVFGILIDFDTDSIMLPYDVSLSNSWKKDVQITKYLGGSVKGDWNPYIERTGSISTVGIIEDDPEVIEQMRRLANYTDICHVRTPDGSSYAANVDVSETREEKWVTRKTKFDISVTRLDNEGLDGMTYDEWIAENGIEETSEE